MNDEQLQEIRDRYPVTDAERAETWVKGQLADALPFPVYGTTPQHIIDIHALLAEVEQSREVMRALDDGVLLQGYDDAYGTSCNDCDAGLDEPHKPTCIVSKARAILATQPQQDGD